jgi:hypothetical protein
MSVEWVKRRKEETAKSIADLHKEVAKEEEAAKMKEEAAKMNRRASATSQSTLRRSSSMASAPPVVMDDDGFVQIKRGSIKKVGSKTSFSPDTVPSNIPSRPKAQQLRRAQSTPVGMNYTDTPSPSTRKEIFSDISETPSISRASPLPSKTLPPEECVGRTKSLLKEYFVGGDTADAVLSVHEMVRVGTEGSSERGAKVIEAGVLLVMEMKETDVNKFLTVMEACIKESRIDTQSIMMGLNDPIEFLSDIEIDAPLARSHLALIVAKFIKWNALSLDLLKLVPEYFRTDGKPANFAIKVLKHMGGEPSEQDLEVVENLMTEEDKKTHTSAKTMFEAL